MSEYELKIKIDHIYERKEERTWELKREHFNDPKIFDEIKSKYLDYTKGELTGEQFWSYLGSMVGEETWWDGHDLSDEYEVSLTDGSH